MILGMVDINPLNDDIKAYAAAYLLTRETAADSDELRKFAAELMSSLSDSYIRQGAKVIGHIKAYIEHETGFLHANTVGEAEDITVNGRDGKPTQKFKLVLNSIIYGIGRETVKDAAEEAVQKISSEFGFNCEQDSRFITTKSLT